MIPVLAYILYATQVSSPNGLQQELKSICPKDSCAHYVPNYLGNWTSFSLGILTCATLTICGNSLKQMIFWTKIRKSFDNEIQPLLMADDRSINTM
mmetsp:Transcript_17820/g.19852  ORF Transcript_17820/g.19852 Transcript_17820/m.19852 type:complete len:96 (+) Transcript_17820:88-375(+)